MNHRINFYELDLLSQIGIAGGWLALILFILIVAAWIVMRLLR